MGGANTTTDSDGDGVPDDQDAFPDDIAASVDTDGDGMPDDWNVGYTANDSATGLTLDDDDDNDGIPDSEDDNPTVPAAGGSNSWLYIIVILVIVGGVAGYMLTRGKGKEPEPADEELVEENPEENPAGVPEENEPAED